MVQPMASTTCTNRVRAMDRACHSAPLHCCPEKAADEPNFSNLFSNLIAISTAVVGVRILDRVGDLSNRDVEDVLAHVDENAANVQVYT